MSLKVSSFDRSFLQEYSHVLTVCFCFLCSANQYKSCETTIAVQDIGTDIYPINLPGSSVVNIQYRSQHDAFNLRQ